jgi:hypothetical protein
VLNMKVTTSVMATLVRVNGSSGNSG